jgi:hypothetical protein
MKCCRMVLISTGNPACRPAVSSQAVPRGRSIISFLPCSSVHRVHAAFAVMDTLTAQKLECPHLEPIVAIGRQCSRVGRNARVPRFPVGLKGNTDVSTQSVQHHDGEHAANMPSLADCSAGQVRLASPRREGTRTWSAIQSSIRFTS